ncbi:acyl-CoA dehydrogenase family protein [Ruicaihuangia caeni]|uniref:Acyl-CoA dehydrogenase family protein n=1 Tax=Ruicaihuangia caeni TaxID=3042517 RepID=A0AAW6TBJ8_9MICO|nr:acyl-CoA dehydrogenase family protein [Klugiella sp. YN-L-19]MDI2099228.1 acyl-CoA dehydrogenase family protein [Klugiella sp. YN-L-19]
MTTATAQPATRWPAQREQRREHALAQVERIKDRIEAGVAEGQREGRLAPDAVEALRESGVFGIMTPDDLGGNVVDPVTAFEIIEAIGRLDPSTAWTTTILLEGAGQLATQLDPERAKEVFSGRLPLKAGSLRPGEAERVDGGYLVTGQWDFVSGVHYADFVSATFLVEGDGGTERRAALIPTSEVEILDSWHVLGMKATGSTTFRVERTFVPDDMIYNPMGPVRRDDTPLAKLTMVPYVLQMHPGMVLGAARRALDEISRMAPTKRRGSRINLGASTSLAESSWFQRELGQLDASVLAARALVMTTLSRVDQRLQAGDGIDLELMDAMQLASSYAGQTAQHVITRAFRHAGAEAIAESGVLPRLLRDINTVLAHGVLGEIGFELHGEFMLGLQTLETRRMI